MDKFAKLILETECLSFIKPNIDEENIKLIHLQSVFNEFMPRVSKWIKKAEFDKPHLYRFHLQVHAQEKEED